MKDTARCGTASDMKMTLNRLNSRFAKQAKDVESVIFSIDKICETDPTKLGHFHRDC